MSHPPSFFGRWRVVIGTLKVAPLLMNQVQIVVIGTAVAQWLRCWFDSRWCHWNFSLTQSFRSHYCPGVDSASNRNEYQEDFLVGKCGRWVRLTTLPPSCAVVMKSGILNFLEPSGPLQACNGTDLPFTNSHELPCVVIWQWKS